LKLKQISRPPSVSILRNVIKLTPPFRLLATKNQPNAASENQKFDIFAPHQKITNRQKLNPNAAKINFPWLRFGSI